MKKLCSICLCVIIISTGTNVFGETKPVIDYQYSPGIYGFQDDRAEISYPKDPNHYGYINTLGEVIIPCEFDDAWRFNDGLAPVEKNEMTGFIKSPYVTSLRINGKHVMTDTDLKNIDGKVMVPIEEVAKHLDIEVVADFENSKIEMKKDNIYANNIFGENELNTNGEKSELTTPIVTQDGVAYMYIRDLADIFGYSTNWESETSTVVLESI